MKLIGVKGRGLRFRTEGEKQADRDASSVLLEKVFTESGVIELISHIVSELLLFQPNDLREWEEERMNGKRERNYMEKTLSLQFDPVQKAVIGHGSTL